MVLDETKYSPAVYKYMVNNHEKVRESQKKYYEANKKSIYEKRKEYIKVYNSKYYSDNKEKYAQYQREKYKDEDKYNICVDCGRSVNKSRLKQHLATKIHQKSLIKSEDLPDLSFETA